MATTLTFDQIRKDSRKIESTLALIATWNRLVDAICIKVIIYILAKLEREINLKTLDRASSEKLLPIFKTLYDKHKLALPFILSMEFPFITKRDKAKLRYYSEYLEDVVEAFEIGLNIEVASKIETAAKGINPPAEIPPWREVIALA